MKVLITNTQLHNGGDAAIVFGIIKILKSAFGSALEITIVDPSASSSKRLYPSLNILQMPYFKFRRSEKIAKTPLNGFGIWLNRLRFKFFPFLLREDERNAFRAYSQADLIVSSGGTYLVEHYDLRARLFELMLPRFANKPLILYTQSLGPFASPEYAFALRKTFEASSLIMLRDEKSRQNLLDIGVSDSKIRVVSDAAFALADSAVLSEAAAGKAPLRRVAISVRSWRHFKDRSQEEGARVYRAAILRGAEWLIRNHQTQVTFISTCQGVPEYWAKDSDLAEEIFGDLPEDLKQFASVDGAFHSPEQLMAKLRGFDLVIATRMHMAIMALASGVPVLPISYEFKTEELFRNLGMDRWLLSVDNMSESALVDMLPEFLAELPGNRARLFHAVGKQQESALKAEDLIRPFATV